MTRINAFISPADLCDKHLLAEHREIVRIPNQVKAGKLSNVNQPKHFTLGTGHVKFFRDKLLFLNRRYTELYAECKARGFNVQNMKASFIGLPHDLFNDFDPPKDEIDRISDLLIDRIIERTPVNAKYTKPKRT